MDRKRRISFKFTSMERFAIIVPDRGDRPELLRKCLDQIKSFHGLSYMLIVVDFSTVSSKPDLVKRIYEGIGIAEDNDIDFVFIIENDDFYPADYLSKMGNPEGYDFIGCEHSYYYNLRNLTWQRFDHSHRSSLFNTGFRISAMNGFPWQRLIRQSDVFLDIEIWKWARRRNRRKIKFVESTGSIGIKHGIGLCGGKGHRMEMINKDPEMKWLEARVDANSFEFYKQLSCKL